MNEEYIEKHLARNVPLDFGECCERVRLGLAPAVNRFRRRDVRKSVEFDRYFKGMIRILIDGDVSPDQGLGRIDVNGGRVTRWARRPTPHRTPPGREDPDDLP